VSFATEPAASLPRHRSPPPRRARDGVKGGHRPPRSGAERKLGTLDADPRRGSLTRRGTATTVPTRAVSCRCFSLSRQPLLLSLTSPAREGASGSELLDRAMAFKWRAGEPRTPGASGRREPGRRADRRPRGRAKSYELGPDWACASRRTASSGAAAGSGLTRALSRRRGPRRRPRLLSPAATRSTAVRGGDVGAAATCMHMHASQPIAWHLKRGVATGGVRNLG
jgi:hypothetical protein